MIREIVKEMELNIDNYSSGHEIAELLSEETYLKFDFEEVYFENVDEGRWNVLRDVVTKITNKETKEIGYICGSFNKPLTENGDCDSNLILSEVMPHQVTVTEYKKLDRD